jgi:hypothetical protein
MQAVAYIVGIATAAGAILYLWKKVLYPAAQGVTLLGKMLPVLKDFTAAFEDNPSVFLVLNNIAAQFRTDSGSSLRDVVNRLEDSAKAQAELAEKVREDREVERRLAVRDREQLQELILKLDRVSVVAKTASETGLRSEAAAKVVASELASAHARADATEGEAGAAADAAMKHSDKT